jgi:hypothetical protein
MIESVEVAHLLTMSYHDEVKYLNQQSEDDHKDVEYNEVYTGSMWGNFRQTHGSSPLVIAIKVNHDGKNLSDTQRSKNSGKHRCHMYIALMMNLPLAYRNLPRFIRVLTCGKYNLK